MSLTVFDHLLAALIGLVLPVFGAVQRRHALADAEGTEPLPLDTGQKIFLYWCNGAMLVLLGGGALLIWWFAERPWQDLGLTVPPDRLGWGLLLALFFLILYAADTRYELAPKRLPATRARWRRDTPFMPETPRELRHSLVLVTAASLSEEILYRGFLIAYVAHFAGDSALGAAVAVAVPAVIFGASHSYQGARAACKIFFLAGVFGLIFVITQSLWIPIFLHFLVDLIGMLLGPKVLSSGQVNENSQL